MMRVSKKEIKDGTVIAGLLSESPVGRLGTIGKSECCYPGAIAILISISAPLRRACS